MASPQIENGHSKIANELLDAICRTNLSAYESRVLWCIIRKTYGWNKKMDKISCSQIADVTGIQKPHVSRALTELESRLIITRIGNKRMGINKDYTQWLPKQVKITYLGQKITSSGKKTLPIQAPQKTIKTLNKSNSIYSPIFDLWNSQRVVVHRNLTDSMKRKIDRALKDYNQETIMAAISVYGEIVHGGQYYWNYKWGLEDFLQRGMKKFEDPSVARQNYLVSNPQSGTSSARPGSARIEYE